MNEDVKKAKIARIRQEEILDEKADEYEKYVYENGVKIFVGIESNLGAQLMRFSKDGGTELKSVKNCDLKTNEWRNQANE